MSSNFKTIIVGFFILISHNILQSQTIYFGSSGLVGANINNPTSLDFGPNNKLYVAQQDGVIWEYEVSRDAATPGNGTYSILNTNQISLIKNNTPNHNDDGTFNSTQNRQITGLLATGTVSNPVLYVTSSDSRIGGGGGAGNDVNLDTNSGILSRLRWNGSVWKKVDLVRGLPRSEENHSTNGLDLFTRGGITYLLIQQGGNANQGAPSNNFAGASEFYLSGALLIVNITQLEQMESANGGPYLDPRTSNTPYIYDLPSLNDPERQDIDNTHPSFPYGPSHPLYNAVIDLGDPFGGNNGLNQTFPENGGPVQIFSPGYRNAYDVVVTLDGRIFTGDNGPNGGWGGTPLIYDSSDQLKGTHNSTTYDSSAGDYITNEFNIENGISHGDALHYVGTTNDPNNTYYGGHPVPIRAFPDKAGVYKYQYNGSNWVENGSYDWSALISGVKGYFKPSGFTMADFPRDTRQGEYLSDAILSPKVNILDIVSSSTNGICEYTASNFDGAMQGDILTASFDGTINRYSLNIDGTTLLSKDNGFFNGFGNIPLDLIALGDTDVFPGTIWVATYGANDITIFEPGDIVNCFQPGDPEYDPNADYDGDGYTNLDEINNGTNHCSAGSKPNDFDRDFISDLNDPDDDNDGIPDNQDVFAIDPQNGLATNLPIIYPFLNNDPGTGFFGLGFTGLQLDPSGNTNYLTQFDPENLSFGGAGGKATVDEVSSGDALNSQNSQENAFQFGINVDSNSNPFTIHAKIETPFNGAAPLPTQSYGIFIGNGDQDNYLKVALMDGTTSGDAVYGFEVVLENNGSSTISTFDTPGLLQTSGVDLYITVDPALNSAQVFYSLNNGININPLGSSYALPANFLDANDNKGLAVGLIGTSGSSGSTFNATWDFINITEDGAGSLPCQWNDLAASSLEKVEAQSAKVGDKLYVLAGFLSGLQITGATEIYDSNTDIWSTGVSMPIPVTHMGIAVVGTDIWVVSGFVGDHPGPATEKVQIYNTVSNSWSFGPDLPAPRGSGAATFNNGKIHYFGGLLPDRVTDVGEHYVLDVNNQGLGWIPAAALPNPRNHHGAASVYGLVYAIGGQYGHDNGAQDQNFLDVYDPATDMWTRLAGLPSARSHFEPGTIVHNGKIIIVGGRQGDFFFDDVTEYNPITNEWSERCKLPEKLLAPAAKVFGDRLIVANGGVNGTCCPSNATRWISIEPTVDFPPLILNSIADQFNQVGEASSLVLFASGGDPNANVTYAISGQPAGLIVEPTNGQIIGNIDPSALNGGPNNDGIHIVTVTATKPGSVDVTQQFTWSVISTSANFWFDKNEDETYTARHECSFVQAGDKFYLFGGRENAQTLDIYDYTSNTWNSLVNSAPVEFNHFQAVEYQGLIWVIGAFKTNNYPFEIPADYIWAFNPAMQEWIQGPEIPASRKRGSAGLVVYNNKFYVLAGNTIGHDGGYVNWFDEYDPATGTWTELSDAPRPRDHFHAAVINGKLYAASGRLTGGAGGVFEPVISEVDVYDFATESWSTLPSSKNIPTPRASAIVVNFQNKLIVAGGESLASTNAFDITEIFDPVSQSWSVGASLNHQRHGTQGIVTGNGIFVVGGSPNRGAGNQKNMEFYGEDNPVGTASVASSLSADAVVSFTIGETKTISITNSGGNIGTLLNNMTLTGADASKFTIDSGDVPFKLIKANATHDIIVSYIGNDYERNATLTITYNNSDSVIIDLNVPDVLSTETSLINRLNVFSNFQNQSIVISGLITEPAIAKLYDMLGRKVIVSSLLLNTSTQNIKVNGLAKGVYIIRIESTTEKMTKKLIIR